MKKRTSNVSRRIVSLLLSLVLALTLVTPAAFATEVVGGSGTTIVEGDTNPADANPSGDNEGKDDENKDTEHGGDEQPTNPGDEDKNPGEGEDDVNASSNEADTQEGEGTDTPVVAQRTVTVERYRTDAATDAAYEVKLVVGVKEDGTTEKLDTTYTINADTKTVTLKLTTADYAGEPIYIKTALDDVLVTEGENQTPALTKDTPTLEYTLPNEGDVTLYYGTQEDFVSAWYGDGTATGYYIRTAEELANFAQLVNSENDFSGKTITLGKNIVLDGSDWTPIGTKDNPFKGTFNGRNGSTYYTISGLNGDLFGVVNGIIQYVTIDGGKGRLVGELKSGKVENCMSTAKVDSSDENAAVGGLVGMAETNATVSSSYYYNADSINVPAVGGSGTVTNCFYLAETSTFDKKGTADDIGARTAEEFQLGRVAYELGASSSVWVYDTTKAEKMPQLGSSSETIAVASELKLTKPDNQPEGVVVTLGSSGKKVLTDAAGNQYYYAASGYPNGVSDVPVTFTAPTGYQIVFAPAATQVGGTDYYLRITGSNVEYTYSLVKADIRWYESAGKEKNYVLKSADELMGFCLLANGSIDGESKNFDGWTLSLGNSIDLENSEWKPIRSFAGAFDGKGYEITGLNVNYKGDDFNSKTAGMFEKLDSTGKILSLAVSGSVKADGKINNVGGIVGTTAAGSEIRFCRSNIDVKVDAANSTTNGMAYGGVAGKVQGAISNCLNEGTITVKNINSKSYIGGVAGQVSSAANLCWNTGSVNASGTTMKNIYTGGIVGSGEATNCYNNGSVTGATDKNKYVTGGISGKGNVANSYNLGDVTGAKGRAYGISNGTVANSYYVCKLNGKETAKYVNSGAEQEITATTEDGKTVYKVGDDVLVNVLNENRGTYIEWINKQDAPNNPVHITRWDGSFEPGVEGVITLVYDPNGGEGAAVTEQQRVEGDTGSFTIKSDTELGFKHENGTFLGWDEKSNAATPGYKFDASKGTITPAEVSVKKGETVTLYAVWQNIWDTDADGAYLIKTPDDLQSLQTQVNDKGFNYKGKWFRLANDIDMTQFDNWTPIGIVGNAFAGNLDGNHYTIRNLKVNVASGYAGMFGYASYTTFQNLTLDSPVVTGNSYCGSLIGYDNDGATLINITANNVAVNSGNASAGGLVGRSGNISAKNCWVEGGSVTGRKIAAGICTDSDDNSPTVVNCHNSANINTTATSAARKSGIAAGIWACDTSGARGEFTGCTNSGTVSGRNYAAGIATAGRAITSCINSGAVTSTNGLAAGMSNNSAYAEKCGNTGTIKGYANVSGSMGVAGINNSTGASFCYNTGKIISTYKSDWAYGISGYGRSTIKNCFSYVAGENIALAPNSTEIKVTNSYYLASSATAVSSAGTWASADDFASGKVAWGVDGGTDAHANYWTQGANNYPIPIGEGTSTSYYRAKAECGTGGSMSIKSNRNFTGDADNAVYGPKGMSVTVTATPMDNTYALKSMTVQLPVGTAAKSISNPGTFTMPNEGNVLVTVTFGSATPGGGGGYYYGGSGDGTGTGDKDDEGLQDGLNMDVEYDIKGLVLGAYAEWGSNGGNKSFQKWLEENPNVVRALLTNSLDNMATAAVGKKTDEAKDLAALLLASLNEHTGVDGKDGDTIAKALQKYIDSGSDEVFSAWLTGGGGMASGTYESIYGQYASSLAALADRLYSKWEASGTSMTFPVWLDSQQVSMDSLSENADEPDTDTANDPQTSDAPDDVPDGQDTEGGASGNSVWEIIGTVVRENPILVWSIVAVIAALIIVGAVRRYHKVKRDEHDEK